MTRIAVIGAGNVGMTLGSRLAKLGHSVIFGVRDPANDKYSDILTAAVATAVKESDLVIFAVPWGSAEAAINLSGDLTGKILVDATNPITEDFSGLVDLGGTSAAEHIATWAKGATVVKAFNTIGYNIMSNPDFGGQKASLLVASDDKVASATVMQLAADLGFDPIDSGPLSMSKYLEAYAWVWINLATRQGLGRDFAFLLVKR